jgi:hypothetical protein
METAADQVITSHNTFHRLPSDKGSYNESGYYNREERLMKFADHARHGIISRDMLIMDTRTSSAILP